MVGVGSVMTSLALVDAGVRTAASRSSSASGPTSRRASPRSCGSTPSGRAAAARSNTPSAASTSPSGTCSARSRTSPSPGCSAATTATRSSPTARSCSTSRTALREKLKQAVARGFKAIKLGWKPFGRRDAKTDELLIQTARETVGPGVEMMVDAGGSEHSGRTATSGRCRRRRCSPNYDVVWFEEALPPDDLAGFIELRRHSPVPIATGEVLTRRQSFWPFLAAITRWTSSSRTAPSAAA